MTTFLKFASRAECIAAFAPFAPDDETPVPFVLPDGRAVADVGTVCKPSGLTLTDDEGNTYPEMLPIPGYHINISGDEPVPEPLQPFVIAAPRTPSCDFFGAGGQS